VDRIRRGFFQQDRGEEGSSPKVVFECERRQFGLAVMGGFSGPRWLVVALPGGSLAKIRGNKASWLPGNAPRLDGSP
jgi:hypothetical protein